VAFGHSDHVQTEACRRVGKQAHGEARRRDPCLVSEAPRRADRVGKGRTNLLMGPVPRFGCLRCPTSLTYSI
jgi:hypothetical protein